MKEESRSFLNKRTKKLLHVARRAAGDSGAKVFASFFKKKPFFLLLLCLTATACGKVGPNQPPGPPDEVHWPKLYPTQ